MRSIRVLASSKTACLLLVALFAALLLHSGWLCDDAFISFRTADNFVHGFGLTWNIGERVQAYTHPLWLLLFSAVYWVTREPVFTGIFLSIAVSLASVVLLWRKAAEPGPGAALALLVLAYSVAFVDYSTSGLENPLSHLILVGFLWGYLRGGASVLLLSLLAGLAAVNRLDVLLLYLPALAQTVWVRRSWRCLGSMVLGFSPLIVWLAFSLWYYGYPFPNTAYAKLNNDVPHWALVSQGCYYLWDSLTTDPVTLVTIAAAVGFACWQRESRRLCLAVGIALYLVYVVRIGGDFMSGRMLTVPLVAAVGIVASMPWKTKHAWMAASAVSLLGLLSVRPLSLSQSGMDPLDTERSGQLIARHGVCDERPFYFAATGLWHALASNGEAILGTGRVQGGKQLATLADERGDRLVVFARYIGMQGFYAGPRVHLVDVLALCDPLLARLPPEPDPCWRVGHFRRPELPGYLATIRSGKNALKDQKLAEYYDRLAVITRGDLWSPQRLATIWRMNIGQYDHLLDAAAHEIRGTPPSEFTVMGDARATLSRLERAIASNPGSASGYCCRAALLFRSGKFIDAMADFDRAVSLDPDNAAVYVCRGEVRAHQEQWRAAAQELNRAIKLKSSNGAAWRGLGLCHAAIGDWRRAEADFVRATEANPDDLKAHYDRSVCLSRLGQRQGAIDEAKTVVWIAPERALGYNLLARALADAKPLEPIEHAPPELPGELSCAMGRLALVLATDSDAAHRDGREAVRYARLALALFPSKRMPELVDALAAAYAEADRFAEATTAAREAVALAVADDRHQLATQISSRLRLYEAGKKLRMASPGADR